MIHYLLEIVRAFNFTMSNKCVRLSPMRSLDKINKNQHVTSTADETELLKEDFVHVARLVSKGAYDDLRLLLGRLVRKYRASMPDLSAGIEEHLRAPHTRGGNILRSPLANPPGDLPIDSESRLSLIKVYDDRESLDPPLLPGTLRKRLLQIVREHGQVELLRSNGIRATRSVIFVGKPGVGKTLAARWLAAQLQKPLWVLDLTAVMSSLLGKTGNNLRMVIDFAKEHQAILLLDEIDAVGKKRDDDSDVGELKRLVTILLQEVELWPDSGLLLAATNHPDLIDDALWRRFDSVMEFPDPPTSLIADAINRFLGSDGHFFKDYIVLLVPLLQGLSYSMIERLINEIRRARLLDNLDVQAAIEPLICERIKVLSKSERQAYALALALGTSLSHHEIHRLTGVARDTIRKYLSESEDQKG